MRLKSLLLIALLAILPASYLAAATTAIQWVEVGVSPEKDGTTLVVYQIRYKVLSGEMHGFYMGGFDKAEPAWEDQQCVAVDSSGRRLPLDITAADDGRYKIQLAEGESVSSGEVTYRLNYGANLGEGGLLGLTDSKEGKLAYLDWAPSQWDKPMEHMTVTIVYPIQVDGPTVDKAFLKKVKFKTEKAMNKNYLISYYGEPFDGK